MINRIKRNFSQLPNAVIEDENLSSKAKALFWYLASRPDDWNFINKNIQKALGIKDKDTIAKYLKELIDKGWIEREKARDEKGQILGNYEYIINEFPFNHQKEQNLIKKDLHYPSQEDLIHSAKRGKIPLTDNSHRKGEKPESGKIPHYNNNKIINNTNIFKQTLQTELEEIDNFNLTHIPKKQPKQNLKLEILNLNLPQNVGREIWEEFVEQRFEKKTWSKRGAEMLLKKLEGFNQDDREALLRESIIHQWDSVYAPNVKSANNKIFTNAPKNTHDYIVCKLKEQNLTLFDVLKGAKTLIDGKEIEVLRDARGRYFLTLKKETK